MMIQGFSHAGGGTLSDKGLDDIGQIFEGTEKNHSSKVKATVQQQFIDVS